MIVQVDPVSARMICPLCNEVLTITITLRPVAVEGPGGQLGVQFDLVGADDASVWDHVQSEHPVEYRRDFPNGAIRGVR